MLLKRGCLMKMAAKPTLTGCRTFVMPYTELQGKEGASTAYGSANGCCRTRGGLSVICASREPKSLHEEAVLNGFCKPQISVVGVVGMVGSLWPAPRNCQNQRIQEAPGSSG